MVRSIIGFVTLGGTRRLDMAPHLAYGDRGVPGVIPAGAALTAELTILEACPSGLASRSSAAT